MKLITITRKIQLLFNTDNKDEVKEYYETLWRWQRIVHKAANMISSHHYAQENIKEMIYLREDIKMKLANSEKDELGILSTSKQNSTYQVLSKRFLGEIPASILTALNSTIVQTFNKEKKEYFTGLRSLRSYKRTIPIPIRTQDMINMRKETAMYNGKPYEFFAFTQYRIPFKINFGKDLSGNRIIWERMIKGEYKLCDSSLQLDGNKIFMLAVFQFERENYQPDPEIIAECHLDIDIPVVMNIADKTFNIGGREEFLYRRIALQGAMRRLQKQSRYSQGGKGRERKLQAIEKVGGAEKNYVNYKTHQYSAKMIQLAIANKVGKIILKNQEIKEAEAKEDKQFLLRNWSYYDLKTKIQYKADRVGIEVVVE